MVRPSASVGASSGNAAARRDGPAVTFAGWPAVLGVLSARGDLSSEQARTAMSEILEGAASPAQIAGFIVALRMKGETVDELTGLLQAMLDAAERVELPTGTPVVDVVGTGGDRAHTINVSTLSALVVAGAGGRVCKHGNRAASSSAGSADVLEALGVRIDCGPDDVARCVAQAGIGVAAFSKLVPIAIIVSVLLVIVVLSYRQTIYAYPSGGGAYAVARANRSIPHRCGSL